MTRKVAIKADAWIEASPADRAMASLDMAMPAMTPPASLWARIEQKLAAAELISVAGLAMQGFEQGSWHRLAPGIRMKRLWNEHTMVLDCEPGAVVPAHRHYAFEHTLILSGDVISDEGDYAAGDYVGMPAGTDHSAWSTRGGCRVLIQYDA